MESPLSSAMPSATGADLLRRLALARSTSDALFRMLRPRAWYARPIPERHRFVFYLGHLETFDWNLVNGTLFAAPAVHDSFDRLFAFGIDPVGTTLPDDQPGDWPPFVQVQTYGRRLRERIDAGIAHALSPVRRAADDGLPELILNAAIEHRLMHIETLSYMLHGLPFDQKSSHSAAVQAACGPVLQQMVEIPSGLATLGMQRGHGFGWDNEYPEHATCVPRFSIQKYKVTNGEFLAFLRAGGYTDRSSWSAQDWDWKEKEGISHPKFWSERDGVWLLRTMFDEIPLPGEWPVYVSQAEASAYARWSGCRLPSEAQYHRAAFGTPAGYELEHPWGTQRPGPHHGNFDLAAWTPSPVNAHPAGDSAFGVSGLVGNGWEWTETVFAPFQGFEPYAFYPGYSADFFDGKHYVIKGGSPRTAACLLRRSFRNWFQPHYPHMYAGFRCVSA